MSRFFKLSAVLLLGLIFYRLFLPFIHASGDLNYSYKPEILDQLRLPQTWGVRGAEGLGENSTFILWGWPLTFIYSLVTTLLGSYNTTLIILGYGSVLFLATYSIQRVLSSLKIGLVGKLAGIILYLCNTYLLLLLDGGQLPIALAYSILPLAYLKTVSSFDDSLKEKIKASLLVFLVGIFDIRFVYLLGLLVAINLLTLNLTKIKGVLSTSFTILVVFAVLNLYWIIPFLTGHASTLPGGYQSSSQLNFLSFTSLSHSLALLQPHWYKNVFGNVGSIGAVFFIIPLLVFLAPIFAKRNKELKFWLIVAVIGIFLSKGSNPPFGEVYTWLFANLPGFSFFRDSTKFFTFTAFAYSVIVSFFVDFLVKNTKPRYHVPVFLVYCCYFVLIMVPVWSGKMTGAFSTPVYQGEYKEIENYLENDDGFGRVLWLSNKTSLGYSSPTHPSVETARIFSKRPFTTGVVGSYETNNFLREASYMGDLFDIYGIKYIAYPYPDERRIELKQDNVDYYYSFLYQLTNLPWIEKKVNDAPVALLETKNTTDRFFIAPNSFNVVGSDKILSELHEINNFDLAKNVLSFSETSPNVDNNFSKVILYKKSFLDFISTKIPDDYFIFPSRYLDNSPNQTGWWKRDTLSFLWVRDFLQQKYSLDNADFDYGGGYAFSEGEYALEINSQNIMSDNILFARVLLNPKGGSISFYQNNDLVGSVETRKELGESDIKLAGYGDIPDQVFTYSDTNFAWVRVGEIKNEHQLSVTTSGEINVLNALISIPKDVFDNVSERLSNLNIINFEDLSDDQRQLIFSVDGSTEPNVSYQRIAPTHYKVVVGGIESSQTLVFSETFDSLWQLDGQPSFTVYNNLNGFEIDHDGTYDLYFTPQKYVNIGFVVSITALITLLSYLLLKRK